MNIFSDSEIFRRPQGLGITFVEYTICVLLDLWGAFLQEKYPRVRLLLENLIFYAFFFLSVWIPCCGLLGLTRNKLSLTAMTDIHEELILVDNIFMSRSKHKLGHPDFQ